MTETKESNYDTRINDGKQLPEVHCFIDHSIPPKLSHKSDTRSCTLLSFCKTLVLPLTRQQEHGFV